MRTLRASLIQRFKHTWDSHVTHGRIQATVIQLASQLLASNKQEHGVLCQLLSHGRLHRYILVIHCPDQAFYPDAIRSYLQKNNIQPVQQQSILFSRAKNSLALTSPQTDGQHNSLILAIHLPAATITNIQSIQHHIQQILLGVQYSVHDFPSMQQDLQHIGQCLQEEMPIATSLIHWMLEDHYLLFGLIHQQPLHKNKGICKNQKLLNQLIPSFSSDIKPMFNNKALGVDWLHLPSTFAHLYSAIHIEAVRLCWLEQGEQHTAILIGHFSRGARYINASRLPHLSSSWSLLSADKSLQQSAFYQREVRTLFDRVPKHLLQAVPALQWLHPFKSIVDMNSPTQVVTARLTPNIGQVEYLLIAVNNQRFGNNIWRNMQQSLAHLNVQVLGHEHYTVGSTHLIFVAVQTEQWPHPESLQQAMRQCVIFWKDQARQFLLQETLPAGLLHDVLQELNQISNRYQDQFPAEQFVRDVLVREKIAENGQSKVRMNLIHDEQQHMVEIHLLSNHQVPLGIMTEKLNAFALVTMEQTLVPFAHKQRHMHISRFRCVAPEQLHPEGLPRLCHGIQDVFNHLADHDPLNALIILCGLNIRDITVLISLRNHLTQLMPDVSAAALSTMMIKQKKVSLCLFRLFEGKHRPAMPNAYLQQAKAQFKEAMLDVQSLKEDTWFHALADLIHASVRSNAWVREAGQALAIKFNPQQLAYAPLPRPYREIFVHGVCVEGIHLRGGYVARGGLRFSDRPSDFRTEVLELMATQVVKNGQIVPTGAKGGFVVRDGEGADFVLAQYRLFIRALLSISDNRVADKVVPPQGINIDATDHNDSYLVVAADKGTARYSDDANAEALNAGFWLGDAFASGGSDGYDHKIYGITARGSWACAVHHFARLGVDLWQDTITAVGIGDMGGDVFGNGMLLNPNMQLLAAFNHIHIFLDPKPQVQASFQERKRLFDGVLGWGDYQTDLISDGGGVFNRAAKSITLSPAMQEALGIKVEQCSGEALIQHILQAPVDLLYNGGIGTYIKASFESDADAQDPANNAVRIEANHLRCKVLNEGGNLGLTQAARIEFAQQGGIINTDAIDNAAGVNMSDHEVNLKILLVDEPFKQRNRWLKKVADAVTIQCLNDNKEQAIALSLAEYTAQHHLPRLVHLQQCLYEEKRLLSIEHEAKLFSLRPVYAEWLGHEKNRIHQALDDAEFFKSSMFGLRFLTAYFAQPLRKPFALNIAEHPLASDIAHTRMSSFILNRYGLTSIHYLQNLTQLPITHIVQAILIADHLLTTTQAYHEACAGTDVELQAWYHHQQDVLNFAEGLLYLPHLLSINYHWLKKTHQTCLNYIKSHEEAQLTTIVTAIPFAQTQGAPLRQALDVMQLCMDTLPFAQLEGALRTPLWGNDDAHALRCEWLQRLQHLKTRAATHILKQKRGKGEINLAQWLDHPLLDSLHALSHQEPSHNADQQRLRYILALTHLQSIVESQA